MARERFGFRAPDLDELVRVVASIIDGAQYPDARTAVELGAPAMKLTLVIEAAKGSGDRAEDHRLDAAPAAWRRSSRSRKSRRSTSRSTSGTWIPSRSSAAAPREEGGVVFFDLAGYDMEGYNKFIPYYLFPAFHLHGFGEPFQLPHQDLGGLEPLGARRAAAQPGHHLRALRRRRPRARGRHQPAAGRPGEGAAVAAEIVAELSA